MANVILKEIFKIHDKDVSYELHTPKDEDKQRQHHYSYFACTCDDEDKAYWKQRLRDYMPDFDPEVHADMVSQLVMEINHVYHGSITIDSDMWFGISTLCHIWDKEFKTYELVHVYMQCDEVSIGLMAIIDILSKVVSDEQD